MSEAQQQAAGDASDAARKAALAAAILKASQPPTTAPIASDYVDAPYRPTYVAPKVVKTVAPTVVQPDYVDAIIREEIAQTPGAQTPETITAPPPATTPTGREIDYGTVVTPVDYPSTPSGREIDLGIAPTYTVTTPEGTETFTDYMDAQNYAIENSPIVVKTIDDAGNETLHTFKDPDSAQRYIDRMQENYVAAETQGIPGPGLGPRPGSFGAGISTYLTDLLHSGEMTLESYAIAIRNMSSDSWKRAAEAKDANDVFGTITGGSLATAERILAGVYEGATFIVRPVQWGQLVSTPILIASNPAGYAKAVRQDLGGLILEGVGAYAGGFLAGKSLNYGIDLAKGVYNRSELAQLSKIHPLEEIPDYSSNARFGELPETSYSAQDPLQRLRGRWSTKTMYSSLVPVIDLDRIILNPRLILRIDPAALGAVTSLSTINRVEVKPTISSIETVTVTPSVVVSDVTPSISSYSRVQQQTESAKIVPITKLIDETFIPTDERVEVETRSGIIIVPVQPQDITTEVVPLQTPVQEPDVVVDQAPVQEQAQDVVTEPVVIVEPVTKEKARLLSKKGMSKRREDERRRQENVPTFTVRMRFGRKSVTRLVEAESFHGALVKVLRGSPSEVEVRRRG